MSVLNDDTIAAIATAAAPSGIGIVRISGPEAIQVADRMYRQHPGKPGKKLVEQKAYTVHHGYIVSGEDDQVIDEVLVVLMRAPHSYTGEDTAEIDCHGGILATRRVLEEAFRCGARPAEPGEYSKRAFLNGRMDLSQAEAIMDIISAKNDMALKSAERQLEGSLSDEVHEIRQTLLHETARIEAALDDPEHMSLDGYEPVILNIVEEQQKKLNRLIESADSGKYISEGLKTVITGKPNAGKSSLLNYLTGKNRAIVTDIAGTTRDVLEEVINIRGITLRLLDTAGIRNADNSIEKIGVERASEQVKDADLVLYVVDSSVPLDENDRKILEMIRGRKVIVILNKTDLNNAVTKEDLENFLNEKFDNADDAFPVVSMSAREQTGIEELENTIENMFFEGVIENNDQVYITNERHREAIKEASDSLSLVLQSIRDGMPEDFWSIDLMGACDALGKITGETAGEDLVNEIFSKFCMGK
ncbi:MAG: tRNA uridine-5-carboxymethylaminomethyl(34) synthesis GTPase MnmE [Bilifractor sp.]|jgi:tRNA modification GTPase